MSEPRSFSNSVTTAVIIAAALIVCTLLLTRAFVRARSGDETIRVTGSARQAIRSDFIIWHGSVSYRAADVPSAYRSLQAGVGKVKAYLLSKGIPDSEIFPDAVETKTLYVKTKGDDGDSTYRQIEGYELTQEIEVRSHSVDLVDSLSRTSTELIAGGVPFQSEKPEYVYTKLSEMKVAMLAEAARNARMRAEQIARSSGCRVGDVRFARMGVMQITPVYATTDVSDQGTNDTTSLDKSITAVVTMGFSIR